MSWSADTLLERYSDCPSEMIVQYVAHDIRNRANSIARMAELLLEAADNQEDWSARDKEDFTTAIIQYSQHFLVVADAASEVANGRRAKDT